MKCNEMTARRPLTPTMTSSSSQSIVSTNPNEVVLSYVTMRKALDNCRRHGKRLGNVANPMHHDNFRHDQRMSKPVRAGVDMYSVMAMRNVVVQGSVSRLSLAIGGKQFSVSKPLPLDDPEIASRLKVSPFGEFSTMATVIDKSVRDALEITDATAELTVDSSSPEDDCESERFNDFSHVFGAGLKFEFDKLNVYGVGGHFKPHVDTPSPGVLGSLVVVLPNEFTGGTLVIRHGGEKTVVRGGSVAFFASCEHEVRPVTSGTRVSLAFKIKAAENHCMAALAPTEMAKIDVFVDQLHRIGQTDTKNGVVGVLLTHEYSLGACQRGELLGIDRAMYNAIKARFPATMLTSVIAHSDYSEPREEDDDCHFESIVYLASLKEIERLATLPKGWFRGYGYADKYDGNDEMSFSGVPFLRANGWNGTELLDDHWDNPHYGNEGSEKIGEAMYLHAALVIPTGQPDATDGKESDEAAGRLKA